MNPITMGAGIFVLSCFVVWISTIIVLTFAKEHVTGTPYLLAILFGLMGQSLGIYVYPSPDWLMAAILVFTCVLFAIALHTRHKERSVAEKGESLNK